MDKKCNSKGSIKLYLDKKNKILKPLLNTVEDNKEKNSQNEAVLLFNKNMILYQKLSITELKVYKMQQKSEKSDIRFVSAYSNTIQAFYEKHDYQTKFNDVYISFKHRSDLINWIIGYQSTLNFSDDTLYFCIYLIDNYLQHNMIYGSILKLFGISCLFIAGKYEEINFIELKKIIDAVNYCEKKQICFGDTQIKWMERKILQNLNYDIIFVNPLYFIRKSNRADFFNEKLRLMAKYFLDLMLMDEKLYSYSHKIKSTVALYFARKICQLDHYENLFFLYSNLFPNEIKECCYDFIQLIKQPQIYQNIEKKYSDKNRMYVNIEARQILKL